ncbi:hypothetical protein [Roseinatronobacter sp. NSM]|uniref:hypothetical protein n=1 Tax=Roseinatronobacter sp. NSM TaxID=3457785 RepID=UPI004036CBE3
MIPRSWIIGTAAVALVTSNGVSLLQGKAWGERVANAQHDAAVEALEAELEEVTAKAAQAESERLELERERNDLLADLDRQGDAADGAGRVALPADSVRRIDAIGRAP